MLECVVNISEGIDKKILDELSAACNNSLLDVHSDRFHNRSVFTLAGSNVEEDARGLATRAIELIDINSHAGVHPRFGVVDVVPFVPLDEAKFELAMEARNSFAQWLCEHGVPCFLYGPERTLPYVRKNAFHELMPTLGSSVAHPTAGACAVGARNYLVAYNLWLKPTSMTEARVAARELRGPYLRTLALEVGDRLQISCNLIEPSKLGPAQVYDMTNALIAVDGAELVGLLPSSILNSIPPERWHQVGVSKERTIEARLS